MLIEKFFGEAQARAGREGKGVLGKTPQPDPRKLAKPSNKSWEGSTEYYYFSISKPEDINYALDLIKQSYKSAL